jgi:hypothetical protein
VIRRTIATLAKDDGHVKDIQGMMRHSRVATTTDGYQLARLKLANPFIG